MAVTTSSGNGFELYNGYKYPVVPVSVDNYSTCYIMSAYNSVTFVCCTFDIVVVQGSTVMNCYAAADGNRSVYNLKEGQWIYSFSANVEQGDYLFQITLDNENLRVHYTSSDILYRDNGSLYIAASRRIPLDGYKLIEWDGDTEGLTTTNNLYLVSDYFEKPSYCVAVYENFETGKRTTSNKLVTIGDDVWSCESETGGLILVDAYKQTTVYYEKGLYFKKDTSRYYVPLFAYKASYDRKAFLSGLAMGLCGKGNPTFEGSGKMLYSGLELPKIPTVDGYGYAAMHRAVTSEDTSVVSRAVLYLSTMPLECSYANNHITLIIKASASGSVIRCEYNNGDSDWTIGTSKAYNTDGTVSYDDVSIKWANYDMLWSHYVPSIDGTVACHASDPVPVEDTFTKGYKTGAALRRKRTLPVAYLYNGVRLPKLPEWDKTAYPCACISYNVTVLSRYCLLIGTELCYRNDADGTYDFGVLELKRYNLLSDGTWKETTASGDCHWIGNINREWDGKFPVWTTADIIREDGSVYLAASDPVPVYE